MMQVFVFEPVAVASERFETIEPDGSPEFGTRIRLTRLRYLPSVLTVPEKAFTQERPDNGRVDWYYKAALAVGLIWATARVMGAYGESARDLDINFLFGFLLTTGGWAAVFLVIDRVAKFLGWRRRTAAPEGDAAATATADVGAAGVPVALPASTDATRSGRRTARRSRR